MMSGRDNEVERICQAALDRDPTDRLSFLAEACGGDDALRCEVEALLAQETAAERFIETPALQVAARQPLRHDRGEGGTPAGAWAWGGMMTPGFSFGPYEIHSMIGAGGMGDVYRARDTRLHRDVALKVLPDAFALDPERVGRFQREAQVLASLNHPNIALIHGLEEANGIQALVLEFVDGVTLADRIARGPIPLDEALAIARQIAEALEAAHEKGIVHRDLKPANIKIRSDGIAKVLDFGLSKMLEAQPAASVLAKQVPASMPGTLLGTAAYMSPEQAKGHEVDRRTDVWAFGCVLFEMLTACGAFRGHTTGEILADVLKTEPDWERLPAGTPEEIRRLLRRCLQKDRRLRLHDIADARIEIAEASTAPNELPPGRRTPWGRARRTWTLVAVVSLVALGAIVWTWRVERLRSRSPEMRVEITTPPTTDPVSLEISPDGQHIVFVATFEGRPRLWLRPLGGVLARPLPGTDFAAHPFWSPNGRSIGFFANQKLKRVDLDGGTVLPLARVEVGLGGTWTRDGVIFFSARPASPILRVPDTGGDVVPVTQVRPPQVGHRFPRILPDGRHFLYYVAGAPETSGVYSAQLDGSDTRRLFHADSAAIYVSGHLLFVRQGALHAVRFNPAALATTGSPFSVAEQVALDRGFGRPALSAAIAGQILYRENANGLRQQFLWFDRAGKVTGTMGEQDSVALAHPSLSPDGRRVAMTRAATGNTDVWLVDTIRGTLSRFTSDPGGDIFPIWSPDGSQIVFGSNRRGRGGLELYQKSTVGTGDEELLAAMMPGLTMAIPDDWSRDGRFIVFRDISPKGGYDLWALPLEPLGKPFPVVQTEFEEASAQFSPDGKWIAYQSDQSGRSEVYIQPFAGPGARMQISTAGGSQVRWSHDGKELFYIALDSRLMSVPIRAALDGRALDPGTPVPLFLTRILGGLPGQGNHRQQYMVSQDGQRFLVHSVVAEDTSPIIIILNWNPKS